MRYKSFWKIDMYGGIDLNYEKFFEVMESLPDNKKEEFAVKVVIAKYKFIKEYLKKVDKTFVYENPLCEVAGYNITNGEDYCPNLCIWNRFVSEEEKKTLKEFFTNEEDEYNIYGLCLCEQWCDYHFCKSDLHNFTREDLDFIDEQLKRLEKFKRLAKRKKK